MAEHGFDAPLAGGVYALQSRLSDLVARSVVWSLGALLVLFVVVAGVAAGSPRVGIAAGVATGLVPLGVLGAFGALGVPLDVIAAPAASVGLGFAADAALHAVAAWRRLAAGSEDRGDAWMAACREQWRGIVRCTGIVALGFGLFAFSIFPPTQRFGLGVAWAAMLGALVSLQVLPAAARGLGVGRTRTPKREKMR